jgi:hypothetical protein
MTLNIPERMNHSLLSYVRNSAIDFMGLTATLKHKIIRQYDRDVSCGCVVAGQWLCQNNRFQNDQSLTGTGVGFFLGQFADDHYLHF